MPTTTAALVIQADSLTPRAATAVMHHITMTMTANTNQRLFPRSGSKM